MSKLFTDTVLNMTAATAEPQDYTGEDGLLYCGKCHTAKGCKHHPGRPFETGCKRAGHRTCEKPHGLCQREIQ